MSVEISKEEYRFLANVVLEVQAPVKNASSFVDLASRLAKLGEEEKVKEGEVVDAK